MDNINQTYHNPLKLILNLTIFTFFALLIIYIATVIGGSYVPDKQRAQLLLLVSNDIRSIANAVFQFVRPFIQLVLILIILEWLLKKFGFSLNANLKTIDWNVQTIIALVIMVAFALAALSGIEGAAMLKDVALVVVGFYFGTQKRTNEIVDGDKRHTIIEEHTNDREKDGQK